MGKTVERRNRSKRQASGHQKRVVPAFIAVLTEQADEGIEAKNLGRHLAQEQCEKHQRSREQGWQGYECSGSKKIKRREESHGQRPKPSNPVRVPRGASREHHASKIR